MNLAWLDPYNPHTDFPPVEAALLEPNGLLAAGGDLSTERLLLAYQHGIFPWYEEGQPILWWSPDPRAILFPERLNVSRSLRKTLRNKPWTVTFDTAFDDVISACAAPRGKQRGTWITIHMMEAYNHLHNEGYAHSVEVWDERQQLIGGLYGVGMGKMFFGESMFSRRSDASKIALVYLVRHTQAWGYPLIDCQLESPHIDRLGAEPLPRQEFVRHVRDWCCFDGHPSPWQVEFACHE